MHTPAASTPRTSSALPAAPEAMTTRMGMRSASAIQNRPPSNRAAEKAADAHFPALPDLPEGCVIGANCYAVGLHAGEKKIFTAALLGVRKNSPQFLVKYLCDENGRRSSLYLPDVRKTYVMLEDVQPWLPREGPTPCSAKTRAQRSNLSDEQAAAERAARKRPRNRTGKRVTFAELPPPLSRSPSPGADSELEGREWLDSPADSDHSIDWADEPEHKIGTTTTREPDMDADKLEQSIALGYNLDGEEVEHPKSALEKMPCIRAGVLFKSALPHWLEESEQTSFVYRLAQDSVPGTTLIQGA
ncbi:hypothetical protein AB1Y20_013026 [Prymnesium parvum]|uniref:Uncharacterized protein n=1 Tax=Prymnesium parvum TaxID=97485 RepID=A0AB34IKH1_PRYPA|mmetsp:Transcript_46153/g.105766  ORF Transcript_46153/g.105766 Transcript_46153/m.105766 type:complete len:302 (+) Transcript_46153:27-932(+)